MHTYSRSVVTLIAGALVISLVLVPGQAAVAGPGNGEVNHYTLEQFKRVVNNISSVHTLDLYFVEASSIQEATQAIAEHWLAENAPAGALDWGIDIVVNNNGTTSAVITGPGGTVIIIIGTSQPQPPREPYVTNAMGSFFLR